jgi:peptidase M48-like protein
MILVIAFVAAVSAQPQRGVVVQDAPLLLLPDRSRAPLLFMEKGVQVDVIRREGEWFNITVHGSQWGDRTGYVEARYLRLIANLPPAENPGTPTPPLAIAPPTASDRNEPIAPKTQGVESRPPIQNPSTPAPASAPPVAAQPRTPAGQPAASAKLREIKIRGYVTEMRSPTDFDIEDYRITRDEAFVLDFENASPDVTFRLQDIRVGVELEIKGFLNEQTGELKAKAIKVDLEQFRTIKQTAFVSKAPEGIQLLDGSWAGDLRADAQTIRVTNTTNVLFKPTKREAKLAALRQKSADSSEDAEGFETLKTLDDVEVGMAMTYEGSRDRETGTIIAERIEFSSNDLEDGEAKLWKSLKVTTKEAQGFKPGELKIDHVGKFKLLTDVNVQQYVARVGQSLIPAYQRDLAPNDPRKIPFQFHVVQTDEINAFATPNGIVVVYSGLLEMLENEAQLAAILGHEIAHATHEHTWRGEQYHKKTRIGIALAGVVASAYGMRSLADLATMVNGAIVNGHQRTLENQSDRIGLEYMYAAGYDVRQAPDVWKLMVKKNGVSSTNFFWSNHDNEPTRRSYLMNELKNNYRDADFGRLHTNDEEYLRIRAAVTAAKNAKRRLKVS